MFGTTRRTLIEIRGFLAPLAESLIDALRRLSPGKPAPEIEGVDLDGKPMKLSDYLGKVVVLYVDPQAENGNRPAGTLPDGRVIQTPGVPDMRHFVTAAKVFDQKPVVFLGVVTGFDRAETQKAFQTHYPLVRFWWDPGDHGQSGPIRRTWSTINGGGGSSVIDARGVIRFTHISNNPVSLEAAVGAVMSEKGQ